MAKVKKKSLPAQARKDSVRVDLNGTDVNPFHKMGLTQNPFPQIARAEYDGACRQLAVLGGDPIPDTAYIREKLKGFAPEFVDLCCAQFKKGEYVSFLVTWPGAADDINGT